jgi:hypothetical protein
MDRKLVILLLAFALLLYGCAGGQAKQCPSSCDDDNPCTTDFCDASTNFECGHTSLSGEQTGCSGSAGLCKTKLCSSGSCITNEIKNCYANDRYNFSVIYPDDWQVEGDAFGTTVAFSTPVGDNLTADCNVIGIGAAKDNLTDQDFIEYENKTDAFYGRIFTNYSFVSGGKRTVNGVQGYEMVWTYSMEAYNFKTQQVTLFKNRTAHKISCTAVQDLFDNYKPKFDSIITSFKFE